MVGKNTLAWFRKVGGYKLENQTTQHPVAILAVCFLFSNWSPCKIPLFSTPNHKKEQYKMSGYLRNVAVGQKRSAIHQDCVATRRLGFRQRRFLTPNWPTWGAWLRGLSHASCLLTAFPNLEMGNKLQKITNEDKDLLRPNGGPPYHQYFPENLPQNPQYLQQVQPWRVVRTHNYRIKL